MDKLTTVKEYAAKHSVSEQSVYQRIKRGTLECVVENGVKYILEGVERKKDAAVKNNDNTNSSKEIKKLYKAQIKLLKTRIKDLEQDLHYCRNNKDDNYARLEDLYKLAVPTQIEYKRTDADVVDVDIKPKKKKKKKNR